MSIIYHNINADAQFYISATGLRLNQDSTPSGQMTVSSHPSRLLQTPQFEHLPMSNMLGGTTEGMLCMERDLDQAIKLDVKMNYDFLILLL